MYVYMVPLDLQRKNEFNNQVLIDRSFQFRLMCSHLRALEGSFNCAALYFREEAVLGPKVTGNSKCKRLLRK